MLKQKKGITFENYKHSIADIVSQMLALPTAKQLSPSSILIFFSSVTLMYLQLILKYPYIVYSVDYIAFCLPLRLCKHFECLITFRKSNQLLVWLKPHTSHLQYCITKRYSLPHWVMEMIALAPCMAFTEHYIHIY